MKSFELFRFYHDTLMRKRDDLRAAEEEADEADRLAWRMYDNLDREIYEANPDHYDKIVNETSERLKHLREQLASIEDAITHAVRLENELTFLEDEGVLTRD